MAYCESRNFKNNAWKNPSTPCFHTNTNLPEVRTTQSLSWTRDLSDVREPLLAHSDPDLADLTCYSMRRNHASLSFSLFKLNKLLNLSNINAKLWKTIASENSLLKCMGINYWSNDMLNKKKETCLDKRKSFKVINIHMFIFPHRPWELQKSCIV